MFRLDGVTEEGGELCSGDFEALEDVGSSSKPEHSSSDREAELNLEWHMSEALKIDREDQLVT